MSHPSSDYRHGDIVGGSGPDVYVVQRSRYDTEFILLVPSAISQKTPPNGAVLLQRLVDGKPCPVVDLCDGELLAVKPT